MPTWNSAAGAPARRGGSGHAGREPRRLDPPPVRARAQPAGLRGTGLAAGGGGRRGGDRGGDARWTRGAARGDRDRAWSRRDGRLYRGPFRRSAPRAWRRPAELPAPWRRCPSCSGWPIWPRPSGRDVDAAAGPLTALPAAFWLAVPGCRRRRHRSASSRRRRPCAAGCDGCRDRGSRPTGRRDAPPCRALDRLRARRGMSCLGSRVCVVPASSAAGDGAAPSGGWDRGADRRRRPDRDGASPVGAEARQGPARLGDRRRRRVRGPRPSRGPRSGALGDAGDARAHGHLDAGQRRGDRGLGARERRSLAASS